jgi:hypothetical protein
MGIEVLILIVLTLILMVNVADYLENKQYDNDTGIEQSKVYLLKKKIRKG